MKVLSFEPEKIAWILIPKCCTTAVKTCFAAWLGVEIRPYRFPKPGEAPLGSDVASKPGEPPGPHLAPIPYTGRDDVGALKRAGGWTFIGMVRHPLARIVSAYHDPVILPRLRRKGFKLGLDGFDEAVDIICRHRKVDHHFSEQTQHLYRRGGGGGFLWLPDRLLKFEDLPDAWRDVQEIFAERSSRGPLPDLPHVRKTDHRPWPSYYTPKQLRRLARRFRDELALLREYGVDYKIPNVPG